PLNCLIYCFIQHTLTYPIPNLEGTDLRSPLDLRLARIKVIGVMLGWKPDDYATEEGLADKGWMLEQLVLEAREMASRIRFA
ncbi:MAG: hypothetical protein O6852_01300, partial [Gammaproteobacteria bacterium]|nr:hypothetical protein [Gammaproteobacteria bacterium]